MTREWPWGLAVLGDPGSVEGLPTTLDQNGIAAGRSVVAVGIQHAVDGEAIAEVWVDYADEDMVCIHDDEFVAASGTLILSDAGNEEQRATWIATGPLRLKVLVDEPGSPGRGVFVLGEPGVSVSPSRADRAVSAPNRAVMPKGGPSHDTGQVTERPTDDAERGPCPACGADDNHGTYPTDTSRSVCYCGHPRFYDYKHAEGTCPCQD